MIKQNAQKHACCSIAFLLCSSVANGAYASDLVQVYEQAKQYDPQLLQIAAQRDAAFEAINSSQSVLLPQISLAAGYDVTRSNDMGSFDRNTAMVGVGFSQQLYNRSSWVSLALAEQQARQADAIYATEQQSLILRVSTGYFAVLSAQDNLRFVQAEKRAVGRQLEQTQQRFDVGLSAITDVHDAQAQYDAVLANEILAKNEVANSFESLREITGIEYTDIDELDVARFSASPQPLPIQALLEQAQQQNLSLLAARIGQDIARNAISLAKASRLPELTFNGNYSYQDISNSYLGSQDGDGTMYTLGVNLSVPLYTGGAITSQVKIAQYDYVSASEQLEASYRGVQRTVYSNNNDIVASIGSIQAFEQVVVSAQTALEATEAGFDVGTRTIVDVLDATRRLYSANQSLSSARYNYILSTLQLKQATGSLSEQDIFDINAGLIPSRK
ncbi:outer membrane channel protein TolC [Photobacterium rosenbergii]|uniref:Outer membrane channel protein TolC n=1 Tax=Photobacterium rosenbergii TaxID=294936 RepID=A0A2T3NDR5_9GAMM|nr:outer membrane channel protein TolC [Photobacterium rosenbergii]PSW12330.1 outer membrane channel protein TolC [Photobacterium rosenbergii]